MSSVFKNKKFAKRQTNNTAGDIPAIVCFIYLGWNDRYSYIKCRIYDVVIIGGEEMKKKEKKYTEMDFLYPEKINLSFSSSSQKQKKCIC